MVDAMGEDVEEAIAELHISLQAMTDEQIKSEYAENFGEPESIGRFEMTDRLLSKLQQAIGSSN